MSKYEICGKDCDFYNGEKRLIVCIQNDIKNADITNLLLNKIREIHIHEHREIFLVEFLPKHDFQILSSLVFISDKIRIISFESLWNHSFYFTENDICIGTRFHFHLLAARSGARGIFGSVDEYYGIKHDSILDIGSQWQNVDLYRNSVPKLEMPLIDNEKLHKLKSAEFHKVMGYVKDPPKTLVFRCRKFNGGKI